MNKEQISEGLQSSVNTIMLVCEACTEKEFYDSKNQKWSAAVNFAHLTLSAKVVVRGLSAPKIALWFKFGKHKTRKSLSYDQIVEKYLISNAIPRDNPTGFEPRMHQNTSKTFELNAFIEVHNKLKELLNRWSESQLDTYQVPHPLMGKITVRELLCFMIYHIKHHEKAVIIALEQ